MPTFSSEDYIALLQLSKIEGIGVNKIRNIVSNFSSATDVFSSDVTDLASIESISHTIAKRIILEAVENKYRSFAENQINLATKNKCSLISYWDEDYPYLLRKIYDPPVLIFTKGEYLRSDENSISVVGTRNPTNYGRKFTEKIVDEIIQYNITITSGLARGIDTIAHLSALKGNGRSIAVLGSGLDVIYPPENKKLYFNIIESGCVISEYPFGTKPDAVNFPKRNRIISGLSLGTLVIESDIDGGAMKTAYYALDQNREVFALPGNVDTKQSRGTNNLIQTSRAKLITSAEEILSEFGNRFIAQSKTEKPIDTSSLNLFEEKIFNILNHNPLHIDQISEKTELQTSECLVHLLSLEFKGLVKQLPGKLFVRN